MFASPVPLAAAAAALREDWLNLFAYINETCDRIEAVEPRILALLPEPGRRERLQGSLTKKRVRMARRFGITCDSFTADRRREFDFKRPELGAHLVDVTGKQPVQINRLAR